MEVVCWARVILALRDLCEIPGQYVMRWMAERVCFAIYRAVVVEVNARSQQHLNTAAPYRWPLS
jgi:hypothetical protein